MCEKSIVNLKYIKETEIKIKALSLYKQREYNKLISFFTNPY